MRAFLSFELPEDEAAFRLASRAGDWACVIGGLDQQLRAWIKYGHDFKDADTALDAARELLHREILDRGLDIEDAL
mgnify:CR=1 FL=1